MSNEVCDCKFVHLLIYAPPSPKGITSPEKDTTKKKERFYRKTTGENCDCNLANLLIHSHKKFTLPGRDFWIFTLNHQTGLQRNRNG